MQTVSATQDSGSGSAPEPGAAALVDALNNTFGTHAGKRASHAKGFCASGAFVPDAGAGAFVDGDLFSAPTVKASIRFSVGGGNPATSDKSRTVRGMAVRLAAGSESWDLVLVSEPVFFAATPRSFVSFLHARIADPATKKPDPERIAAHNRAYPDGMRQPALLAAHAAPASYAGTPYFSNNAFVFRGGPSKNTARLVVEPLLGTHYLSADEEQQFPDLFLEAELEARLGHGPVDFDIFAQLPAPSDSLTDPSQPWIGTGRVRLGRLRVLALASNSSCDGLVFSPMNLPAAITPSDDPILAARAAAYDVSRARRNNAL